MLNDNQIIQYDLLESNIAFLECARFKDNEYIAKRANWTQFQIDCLREYANKKTGKVSQIMNPVLDKYQARLDHVLRSK